MKIVLFVAIIFLGFACKKNKPTDKQTDPQGPKPRCGVIVQTPVLDSFVYPTYYITTMVAFDTGTELVHFHGDVTGDHDGSWYLPRYDKDSTICTN
ncbi:MAG: hypothetical protein ABI267_10760 [Ginsengibacter sp.]